VNRLIATLLINKKYYKGKLNNLGLSSIKSQLKCKLDLKTFDKRLGA
jgi:hypothetical protein